MAKKRAAFILAMGGRCQWQEGLKKPLCSNCVSPLESCCEQKKRKIPDWHCIAWIGKQCECIILKILEIHHPNGRDDKNQQNREIRKWWRTKKLPKEVMILCPNHHSLIEKEVDS